MARYNEKLYIDRVLQDDPQPTSLIRWPQWLKAGQATQLALNNVFAKVRLGRL